MRYPDGLKLETMEVSEIIEIADKVNKKVNIPLLGEKAESVLFESAVFYVALAIEKDKLPFNDLLAKLLAGETVKAEFIDELTSLVNDQVNLPIIGEATEAKIFRPIITAVVDELLSRL